MSSWFTGVWLHRCSAKATASKASVIAGPQWAQPRRRRTCAGAPGATPGEAVSPLSPQRTPIGDSTAGACGASTRRHSRTKGEHVEDDGDDRGDGRPGNAGVAERRLELGYAADPTSSSPRHHATKC